ncbi:MAG: xanthine dehydrogenase family protein molybdopterin-binding subunit [Myxococcota bacterium]
MTTRTSRRTFIKMGMAAGGALMFGCASSGRSAAERAELLEKSGVFSPNAWIKIAPDNTITYVLDKAEMGQGVMTSQAMLIAEELEIDPTTLKVELASADYDAYGMQMTGGSTTIPTTYKPLRVVAAAAREMLVAAAALKLDADERDLEARDGHVVVRGSSKKVPYGALVEIASGLSVPSRPRLKKPEEFKVIGTPVPRLDVPDKVTGRAGFGIDVQLEGMLHAIFIRPPQLDAPVVRVDASEAMKMKGVRDVVPTERGVAVVAERSWQAKRAAERVKVTWGKSAFADLSTEQWRAEHAALLEQPGKGAIDDGDVDAAWERDDLTKLEAVYELPYLAHATLEPQNATAWYKEDGTMEVWVPTQAPTVALDVAAKTADLPNDKVTIHQTLLGGGFGRRSYEDYTVEAVLVSKAVKAPVKVVWTREEDTKLGYFRPSFTVRLRGSVDESGAPVSWDQRIVSQSILGQMTFYGAILPDWLSRGTRSMLGDVTQSFMQSGRINDPTSLEGAVDRPYAIDNYRVDFHAHAVGVRVGFWRSVGNSANAFPVECFIDELAHAAKKDPYTFRRDLLAVDAEAHARHIGVLDLVAKKAGWGEELPEGWGRGIAQHFSFSSYCAHVVVVEMVDRVPHVRRVVSAIDCGRIINPDIVRAQIEGAVIFGLSAALHQEITFANGAVVESNFHDYPILRMHESPEIEVHLVNSSASPTGVGEPGLPPIAPALANAVFDACGKRVRRLPMLAELERLEA